MPKVEQFGPSRVRSQVTQGARANPNVPAAAFGIGELGKGLADVGKGIAQFQQRRDTTAAEEALVSFEREKNDMFFNPDSGYFNTQGRDAHDNAKTASETLVALQKRHSEALKSQGARSAFDRASGAHVTSGNADIMRHSAKGLQAWEVATINAQTENTVENASLYWNDPDRLRVQNALGRQSVIDGAKLQGIDGEALNERLQNYESTFARSTIEAATVNSASAGQAAIDAAGNRLEGPDLIKMQKMVATKAKAEETQRIAGMSVLKATNIVDTYDSRSDIIAEVNKITDPELRDKTMRESMYQFGLRKQAESETKAEAYNQGIEHINRGGSATSFQAEQPAAWDNMTPSQRNNLQNGKHMITDQVEFNNLLTLPKTQLAEVNAADFVDKLKPSDLIKLRSAVDNAKKGQSYSRVQSLAAKTNSISDQFFGKKAKRNKDELEQVNQLQQAIQDTVEDAESLKGSKLTPTEEDQLLADFTRKITIERSAFGIDFFARDTELDLSNVPPVEMRVVNRFVDQVGEENVSDVVAVRKLLIDNGIPVTADNLSRAYQQATQ